MRQATIGQIVSCVREYLEKVGYAKGSILQFKSTTNQLLKFMDSEKIEQYTTDVGIRFLQTCYAFDPNIAVDHANVERLRYLRKLSEYQLHGAIIPKARKHGCPYDIPEAFRTATDAFLAYRKFEGIIEKNMCTVSLYLERFFSYLTAQSVTRLEQITGIHIHGFLRFIMGYSNLSKNHMMRTVRQFMGFCFKNGYHPEDLSSYAPNVHYEKRAKIPSTYSHDDVMKLLALVDRNNPVGKRNYAILLLIARLGLRAGDVVNLKLENINWEENRISLTQHKTGRPLTLPLLEDVGLAIIDYLKFGRPKCDCHNIFVRHRPPMDAFSSGGVYNLVSNYIGKAGLLTQGKKHGPHALRHSLASRLLEENVPLPVISEILGHADTNTTAAYLSISIEKLRRCALEV
jgi:site-specific recombinase XerD